MALKFLNKKGWHTGSLRNIENVWKAEQKHEAEQKKLEELRKQIHEERERSEFRLLQEQAGLVPKQERLDFLYDSGLAVGKGSSSSAGGSGGGGGGGGFKALEEALPTAKAADASAKPSSSAPGALFEDKPHSANDAWRKLHSDPLLMIRQREQEALARIKNNPVQMALIRKSVGEKKHKEKSHDRKENHKKHHQTSSKHRKHSSSKQHLYAEDDTYKEDKKIRSHHRKSSDYEGHYHRTESHSEDELKEAESREKNRHKQKYRYDDQDAVKRNHDKSKHDKSSSQAPKCFDADKYQGKNRSYDYKATAPRDDKRRNVAPKLSEEDRAARLREMQEDAELHEEQRWKRLKKADEKDAREDTMASKSVGRNFLDAAHRSVYGAEKGGSSTIEESVRRRTHYSQGRSGSEGNAFRR
ncbi:pre-mRNA-splicing factor CWC25 homolog [Herrania umbratica]|uniref:Pre-mRNA-splicing factor CWC25 homolog n=1 Tax=Herrania umbratica TaxID=108875 RepID=A0A6J1AUC7_9ROSI|nr:pre-mRNA-splicing factor CWC25 homolog [Herrania umbratica]XP_021290470.1 pre-mRNA-splicing factor CWC25 homolog [Herrania umbratica]XP_021290471.1 pre-mRNA-splicing factor CWC25 homolog [Herrania umbratica]XP_021290472.1 pre-mRNA-splicing factor CWC25 homolog [Herrania umbratica]XP_021290473.1 pre-mRNA-splicing factor CWC25 homolog [Herrania umbratica]XP_021290474.1 pre-mRNA-splicing factor CWC25 homolog [Herrania umbratica]